MPFAVENPFQSKTKAEVLRVIAGAGFGRLCARSVSCAHTWQQTTAHPHCSECSQCVDRRVAALAAGLGEAEDPVAGYATDPMTGPREEEHRLLVERYYGAALRIDAMPDIARFEAEFRLGPVRLDDAAPAWRERRHDDLVLAVAVAAWYAEARGGGDGFARTGGPRSPFAVRWAELGRPTFRAICRRARR